MILARAVHIASAEGLDSISLARLGTELGIGPGPAPRPACVR